MLGRRPAPGLFEAANLLPVESLGDTIYGSLARQGRQLFTDYQFRAVYSTRGRPSASPALMALACLLQQSEGISDDAVIERMKYDLRWKAALDLDPLSFVAPFSKAAYIGWRTRLILNEKQAIAFEASLRKAVREGLLPKKLRLALDSSPVRGRGAIKDTFNLLSDAIRAVVRTVAKEGEVEPEVVAAQAGLERHFQADSIKGTEFVDWTSEEAKSTFLKGLLVDVEQAIALSRKAGCGSEEVDLLRKIVEQDIEDASSAPAIRQGVAKDRTVSVSDPEARHGHKSNGKTYTGHKAHVATEVESELITAVDVTEPATSDGSKTGDLLAQSVRNTGLELGDALGDCAYGTLPAQEQAKQHGVELRTKMPRFPRKGFFGPGDFEVDQDHKSAVCPAGHRSTNAHKPKKEGILLVWPKPLCSACPLRDRCFKNKRGHRQLLVQPYHHDKRQREAWARSEEGRQVLKRRIAAEHAIGRIKNKGAGTSRYFGRAKTRFQWLWAAALVNLQLIWKRLNERAELAGIAA